MVVTSPASIGERHYRRSLDVPFLSIEPQPVSWQSVRAWLRRLLILGPVAFQLRPGMSLNSERSGLVFRRDNQEESFDDEVAALRERAGAGSSRWDDPEPTPGVESDRTTYSPPQQVWSPIRQAAEMTGSSSTSTPAPSQNAPAARMAPEPGDASVIDANTSLDGTVESSGSLHIHGRVSGQIRLDGDVFVAEGAVVMADVHAGGVTVAGQLEGTVECSGRFEVLPSGQVSANVAAPRLVVHEGARVTGALRMTTPASPAE
jgi:cytoskeletal protein CcmA (bactofilin family)